MPPPRFPSPPANALAVPTTFLSKKPVVHTWQGTKLPPRIPMKKRSAYKPEALYTVPARNVSIEPASKQPANVRRGPKRSQHGPAMRRTMSVAVRAMMLLFATWNGFMPMSPAMTSARRGGKAGDRLVRAYLRPGEAGVQKRTGKVRGAGKIRDMHDDVGG